MPTKIFSAPPNPKPPKRASAWVCAAINQLAFPGLGTILAGRRAGYFQAAIMIAGFCLTMGFMLRVIFCALRGLAAQDANHFADQWRPYAWAGKSGLALCLVAWGWALASSISIVRAATKTRTGEPPPLSVT